MPCDQRVLPFVQAAQRSHAKFWPRGEFVSVTLAQGIVESDYFTKVTGDYNYFGVQANAAQRKLGHAKLVWSREWDGRRLVPRQEWFANYSSPEAAFDAHNTLLTSQWYERCQQAQTPQEYARALKACGYATAENYAEVLIQIISEQELEQFDIGAVA